MRPRILPAAVKSRRREHESPTSVPTIAPGFFGAALPVASVCGCLLLVPITVSAQPSMSKAEAAQLFTAAGFRISNDPPVNRCGKPTRPRVTFMDINGDKRPEALFIDADAQCYAASGRYFAVLAKEGTTWRSLAGGNGLVQALASKTAGFPDMRVTESGCVRDHHYDGRTYKPATACLGEASAAAAQPTQPTPVSPSAKAAASTLQGCRRGSGIQGGRLCKARWRLAKRLQRSEL